MNLSYWERKTWFTNVDYTIVGSGIVGLHAALRLRQHFPESKILILEKGMLPEGASTKNAGFACFGSISEIMDDLKFHTDENIVFKHFIMTPMMNRYMDIMVSSREYKRLNSSMEFFYNLINKKSQLKKKMLKEAKDNVID